MLTNTVLVNDKVIKLNYTVALQCVAINSSVFDVVEGVLPKRQKQVDAYYAAAKSNTVYCFEPDGLTFSILAHNTSKSKLNIYLKKFMKNHL